MLRSRYLLIMEDSISILVKLWFLLIGFDHSEFHRASGEQSSTSINLSTGQIEAITGENMFEEQFSKPRKTKGK